MRMDPIRKDARETFRYFAEQGVQIKVISGDNPVTVSQIAREAGIEGAEHFVDASALSEDDLIAALESNTVFGRVTPEQKRLFVQAMKKAGHTVGMTGDGVNDILALKDADCSVAMASGCEAASQVSQLVLLENDFACMPSVVAEGRRVVNNIQRSASLFLVKNIFSLLMAVFSVCFHLSYPLEPAQVSLISNFTIGFPAFFLALQPEERGRDRNGLHHAAGHCGVHDPLSNLRAAGLEALADLGRLLGWTVGEQHISGRSVWNRAHEHPLRDAFRGLCHRHGAASPLWDPDD